MCAVRTTNVRCLYRSYAVCLTLSGDNRFPRLSTIGTAAKLIC
jgi:hypothetical protein